MSVETVKAFFAKVEQDQGLQDKMGSLAARLRQAGQGEPDDAALAETVKIAAEAGYEFTVSDLEIVRKATSGELSDDDLKQVAGGAIIIRCKHKPMWA